jgi:ADP-ribosylglycohydrolase
MLGAIIGDIVGSRFEFNNTNRYDFDMFTRESTFTDDTICTIAIADAISSGKSYQDSLLEWCRRYPNPKGAYGGSFARWIASDNPQPYNSFGNGSAMRVSPVALAFDTLKEVQEEAKKTALVTHNHPEGIKGAVAVAHAIYYLRTTHDLPRLEKEMDRYYPRFMLGNYFSGVFDETCMGTVPLCLKLVLSSTSFEDAIRRAISWGGDSDTIGAIVGSMAEAQWDIPKEIIDKALDLLPTEMLNVIGDFFHKLNERLLK